MKERVQNTKPDISGQPPHGLPKATSGGKISHRNPLDQPHRQGNPNQRNSKTRRYRKTDSASEQLKAKSNSNQQTLGRKTDPATGHLTAKQPKKQKRDHTKLLRTTTLEGNRAPDKRKPPNNSPLKPPNNQQTRSIISDTFQLYSPKLGHCLPPSLGSTDILMQMQKDNWSDKEDMVLIQAHKEVGNKWADIAKRLPGRTENSVKNNWNATKRRQFARRRSRASSKVPKSGTLLQSYITSLGIGPSKNVESLLVQQPTLSASASSPVPPSATKPANFNDGCLAFEHNQPSILKGQEGITGTDENSCGEAQSYCEEFLAPICDEFSADMCNGLLLDTNNKEDATFQVYSVDAEVDINHIFNHLDHAIEIDEVVMDMAWDADTLGCVEPGRPAPSNNVNVKETDMVEMVKAATTQQDCSR
jgi:hypothetical protein